MIVVKSTLNKNDAMRFNYASMKKFLIAFAVIGLVFILLGAATLGLREEGETMTPGVFLIALGVALPVLYLALVIGLAKRNIKTNKTIGDDTVQTYRFGEDEVYVLQESALMRSEMTVKWPLLYRGHETKDYFYAYISNMQALVISKSNIIEGSVEELRVLFMQKLDKNFKPMK